MGIWFTIFSCESDWPPSSFSFSSAPCITHISLQRNKSPSCSIFHLIFGIKEVWLQEIWLWHIWCEKWSGEVLPFWCSKGTAVAYNGQLLLVHFHFLSFCMWQLSLFTSFIFILPFHDNFYLPLHTFTSNNLANDNFHCFPLSLSMIWPVTAFAFHQFNFHIALPWQSLHVTTFAFYFHCSPLSLSVTTFTCHHFSFYIANP